MSIQKQLKGSSVQIKIHLGSITPSRAIMLNSENLTLFKAIAYDIVFAEDQTNKIYAYPYENQIKSYLILIPINQHQFQDLIFNEFVVLLCIFARTVTLPIDKQYKNMFIKIMNENSISGAWKKGNNYYKVFLDGSARISHIDLESFQMAQYKERTIQEILQIKIKNAYTYSLNYFKSETIIDLYDCEEESISEIYQSKMIEIEEMYIQLAARDRIQIDGKLKDNRYSADNLKSQIKDLILARNTKTIADEQFEQAIYEGLQTIFEDKFKLFSGELDKIKQKRRKHDEQICVYSKILSEILKSLRDYDIQINDQKYLYLTQKINQKILSANQTDQKENKISKNQIQNIPSTTKSIPLCEHNKKCIKTKEVLKKSKSSLKTLVHEHKKQKQKYFETIHIKEIEISRLRQKLAELEKQKAKIEVQTRRFGPTLAEIKEYPLKLTPKVRKVASQKKLVDRSLEFGSLKLYEKQNDTAKPTETQSHNVSTRADKESNKKEKSEFSKNQIAPKKKIEERIPLKKEIEPKKTKPALSKKALNVA